MFDPAFIVDDLERNKNVFKTLLQDVPTAAYTWKISAEKWSLLQIVCHLYDEEREDFRARLQHVLASNKEAMPSIDPQAWVIARKYEEQNYAEVLENFLKERETSIQYLRSLDDAKWENHYQHPSQGTMTAKLFLSNWLAHDYLHIRQITATKYAYLKNESGESLGYAGDW